MLFPDCIDIAFDPVQKSAAITGHAMPKKPNVRLFSKPCPHFFAYSAPAWRSSRTITTPRMFMC